MSEQCGSECGRVGSSENEEAQDGFRDRVCGTGMVMEFGDAIVQVLMLTMMALRWTEVAKQKN